MEPNEEPKSDWLVLLILGGGLLLGIGLVYVAITELVHDRSLGADFVVARARVTDTRLMTSRKRGESYELRYAFEVGGVAYTYGDATGRTDLWATVTPEAWNDARATGTIDVAYEPRDPKNNRAVRHASEPIGDHLAGLCVGLVCMAPGFLAALAAIRKRRARATV